ncbi:hypothetical protein SmJEL517_g00692 [Synchytrium microbalum]|uniref:Small RNA 2'-O-methyltransferase n=1 Tax=Synchytrium microbalum TaxID=1806994 RepID=A0A507CDD9_9FUNG|nr:uncharacterized protein SmJEL517_g00692 [Synchytrium microbalum]TPX37632.1 hypothetical protein SmJEL517_g00692 [Synchytrium microbalum]
MQSELDQIVGRDGSLTQEMLSQLTYLDCVIKEVLRYYPGGIINPGQQVAVNLGALHHNPEYWQDPDKFWPERWENGFTPVPGSYLPFGNGIAGSDTDASIDWIVRCSHIVVTSFDIELVEGLSIVRSTFLLTGFYNGLLFRFKPRILDLGCGEGALLEIVLNDTSITRCVGVDVNESVLAQALLECSPTESDKRFLRERPVKLELYQGSVAEADSRLLGFDAVVSVEVIEHLDPPVLAAFPRTVFGVYRPGTVIITTPNAEFNVNFPSLKYGTPEAILRNDDHRFEWTRAEFQSWCDKNAAQYGYVVMYDGIGLLTSGDTGLGCCTQLAVFTRIDDPATPLPQQQDTPLTPYKSIASIDFPYFEEDGFTNADIVQEMVERTRYLVYIEVLSNAPEGTLPTAQSSEEIKHIHIDRFWAVLRIRQICKLKTRLFQVVQSDDAKAWYAYSRDSGMVTILFDPAMYDTSMDAQWKDDDEMQPKDVDELDDEEEGEDHDDREQQLYDEHEHDGEVNHSMQTAWPEYRDKDVNMFWGSPDPNVNEQSNDVNHHWAESVPAE